MNNSAEYRRASRRRGCRRNNRMRGGAGEGYRFGGPVAGEHIVNNYDGIVQPYASCNEAVRPGYLAGAPIKGGLPGFAGGARKRKGSRKSRSRKGSRKMRGGRGDLTTGAAQLAQQLGGAYTFVPDLAGGVGMMDARYTGCGAGAYAQQNPLNPPIKGGFPDSLITAPPGQVPNPIPGKLMGGRRTRRGRQYGGVGGVDSMFYGAPRSGYTTWPSNAAGGDAGTLADGKTPFLINVPFSAQPTESPNCLKTGGKRRTRKGHKASRKGRKGSRK